MKEEAIQWSDARNLRSISREASAQKCNINGSAYKQMIKQVKHRVDCWNKSVEKILDSTPIRSKATQLEEPLIAVAA